MIEVLDYYAQGLDKRKDVVELHKKANKEYLDWLKKEQGAKPGTPAAAKAAMKKDQWSKALVLFSSEAGRKKYDAELTAWQSSVDAQRAKGQADQLAKEFASATETVLELVERAWEELDKGNLQAASQVASKAMRLDASHWEAYLIAGIASFRQNDFDESMSCMRQAARLNPDSAQVFSGLGELYERQDNWQEAFKHYSKAIALAPDVIDYKIRAGFVCVNAEVPDQGIELLRKALEIDPDHSGAKWVLGLALSESARMGWTEVEDGHPRVPPGWYAMSRQQALQAVQKLHEATSLGLEDPELAQHLVSLKSDVDSNVKRHFTGNWILFGILAILSIAMGMNIGANGAVFQTILMTLAAVLFTAAYYTVNLVPQYATNARVLAGDHALKRGFFDWLENLQNQWIKLFILMVLFSLLPVFVIYWGIKNWTGENAPLGDALKSESESRSATAVVTATTEAKRTSTGSSLTQLKLKKPVVLVVVAAIGVLVLAFAGYYFYKSRNSHPMGAASTSLNTPAPSYSGGSPTTLESRWLGRWQGADGNTVEITPQNTRIEWKRTKYDPTDNNTYRKDLKWTTNRELNEGEFGYSGLTTSPGRILQEFKESLARFNRGEPDFNVDPKDFKVASKWTAMFEQKEYKILHGYGGGDSLPTQWIVNDNGDILEINSGHYGFSLNLLKRVTGQDSNNIVSSIQSIFSTSPTDSVPAPTLRVGDSYTYETLDEVDPKLNNVTTREIVEVNSGGFVMAFVNAKSKYTRKLFYDNNLNLLSTRSGDNDGMNYSPALQYFKFPMKSGDNWTSISTETNIKTGKTRTHTLNGSVDGLEQVTVPSGTFKAFRITIKSELNDSGQISTGQDISWYSPDARRTVKSELDSRDSTGKVGRRKVNLISYRLQ